MQIKSFQVLAALLLVLAGPLAHSSTTYAWQGTCVSRLVSDRNDPGHDIGGCAAIDGIVSGYIEAPDDYVSGNHYYHANDGQEPPLFVLNDPYNPVHFPMASADLKDYGFIDFSIVDDMVLGEWGWYPEARRTEGNNQGMFYSSEHTTDIFFQVRARYLVFTRVVPTPGSLALSLLGMAVLGWRQMGGRRRPRITG